MLTSGIFSQECAKIPCALQIFTKFSMRLLLGFLGPCGAPGCIPRPFRRRNPAESHHSISSRQGFWRRSLVHCALVAVGGASDHKFSKYDGMEAVVFFTLLFSVLFLGCITGICYYPVFFLTFINTTKLALAANPAMPTSLAEMSGGEKKWNALWVGLGSRKHNYKNART